MTCLGSTEFGHRVIHQPVRYKVEATPVTNGNGSQILGFDLNAELGAPISAGTAWMETIPCADGAPLWSNAGVSQSTNGITGGLQVTFNGKSVTCRTPRSSRSPPPDPPLHPAARPASAGRAVLCPPWAGSRVPHTRGSSPTNDGRPHVQDPRVSAAFTVAPGGSKRCLIARGSHNTRST